MHVPAGWSGDGEQVLVNRIESVAPGFADRVVATSAQTPSDLASSNPHLIGGDVVGGSNDPIQLLMRPRLTLDPCTTGVPGVFLCSASTPPGAGVHGMAGYHAVLRSLSHLRSVN